MLQGLHYILYGKNCLGDVAKVYDIEKYVGDLSFQILPEAPPHLPGEREVFGGGPTAEPGLPSRCCAGVGAAIALLHSRSTVFR